MPNTTLSPLEQKIYFAAKNARDGVVSLEMVRSWNLTDEKSLLVILSRMAKKGWLLRLRKGIYLVSEPPAPAIRDIFVVSTYCFPGYNAFSSALYLHGLTDMVPFEVLVATRHESGVKTFGQYTVRAVALKDRFMGSMLQQGRVVSTAPKTIYDCLTHPELGGGHTQIMKAIHEANMDESGWKELFYYAEKFESHAFYQRLGYLLSLLPKKSRATKGAIRLCAQKAKSNIYLSGRGKGAYIPEWKLIDNVGKEALLSWWY
ncbi:hypothetical protein H0O01_01370 [Candidatus Micrarchaeota archaeon]|nr:hypothetical protein [Candidatus Micrarchaeota archaeon]